MATRQFPTITNKAGGAGGSGYGKYSQMPMIGFHAVKIASDSNVANLKTINTGEWAWLPVPPDGVSTGYQQGWDENTTGAMGAGISQLYSKFFAKDSGLQDAARISRGNSNTSTAAGVAGSLLDVGVEKAKQALGAGAGINQRVLEQAFISYSGPGYRSHSFSFSLKPESGDEAKKIKDIVQFFKFYSAPELVGNTLGLTRLYNTPHLFDIMIAPDSLRSNMFLFKASCLQDIQVKYGGEKFSVMTDDQPTSVDLQLSFKEMSILEQGDVTETVLGSF